MKSSYKLYGTFWDNRPISDAHLPIELLGELKAEHNDIHLSDVLRTEEPKEYPIVPGNSSVLVLDYYPMVSASTVVDFYVIRMLQIADYYQVDSLVCTTQEEAILIEKMLTEFAKRKTPIRLLAQPDGVFQMIC